MRLLHKESIIIGKLHLVRSDLTWLLANAPVYGGVDLTTLPVVAGQNAQAVDALLTTVLLIQLNRTFTALAGATTSPPPAIQSLTDLISAAAAGSIPDDAHAAAAFAAIAGAQTTDVQALAASLGISLAAGDYLSPATFDRLRTLLAMAQSTSGSGDTLASWGNEAPDETPAAASALQALKSQYSNDGWLAAAPALNNPLRERRRDALVAYLTAQRDPGFNPMPWGTDTDSLFDYFLIDPEMSSCMDTSRVVQAYAAVQLFVQRCVMNLEPDVTVDATQDEGWQEWQWRQRFRLWQADREIFLWPENYLIEADRPSISELFGKLTQEARQGPSTADALETVVLDYIDGLDKIAHLRVTGMCEDPVSQAVHVVARTHTDPPVFYHRTLANGTWTPWTQIPLNIKAHQVVPAVHRRSLYLFWVEVTLTNEPTQTVPPAGGDQHFEHEQSPWPARRAPHRLQHLAQQPVDRHELRRRTAVRRPRDPARPARQHDLAPGGAALFSESEPARRQPHGHVHRRVPARRLRRPHRVHRVARGHVRPPGPGQPAARRPSRGRPAARRTPSLPRPW